MQNVSFRGAPPQGSNPTLTLHIPLEECYNAVKLQFEKIIITIIAQISAYISALSYG